MPGSEIIGGLSQSIIPGGGFVWGDRERAANAAVSRLGRPNLLYLFDDLLTGSSTVAPSGWGAGSSGGSSSMLAPLNNNGGIVTLATGAVANQSGAIGCVSQQLVYQSLPWWGAARIKFTSPIDATTYGGLITSDSAGGATILAGAWGPNSTLLFSLQHSGVKAGTFQTSGIAFDNNYHVFEIWGPGGGAGVGTVSWAIDYVPVGTYTLTSVPTQFQNLMPIIFNGAGAANRTMECDWIACAGVR